MDQIAIERVGYKEDVQFIVRVIHQNSRISGFCKLCFWRTFEIY
jgi:hypothetical protein